MIKKLLTTLLAGVVLFTSSVCFAGNDKLNVQLDNQLKHYHDMAKVNAAGATIEKQGQLNTRYEYTGFELVDKVTQLGFKRYLLKQFKHYNGEGLELREIPNDTFHKSLHLNVSCIEQDFTIYMFTPDNYIKGKFKQLCELVLPGYGNALYQKVLSTKNLCKRRNFSGRISYMGNQDFQMGGRNFRVYIEDDKYDIFVKPYAPKTVKVNRTKTYTGTAVIKKVLSVGFCEADVPGATIWNPYGKKGNIEYTKAEFSIGSGQYDMIFNIYQSNTQIDKTYKQILNWVLPKTGNKLYKILDTPNLPKIQTVYFEGRKIEIEVNGFGLTLLFSPIYN
jgi:hypothetical protein